MAMEMRVCEFVNMSEDLTPRVAPYATSLHDSFLYSHCSSCFRPLESHSLQHSTSGQTASGSCYPFSCATCCSVRYCCSGCLDSDSVAHSSSSECCFFVNRKNTPTCRLSNGTTELRAALRLLCSLEMRGLLPSHWAEPPNRIGGLLVSGIEKVLEEGGEVAERIQEESLLMSSARGLKKAENVMISHREVMVEKVALWAVIANGVEVQLGEGQDVGVAVYGPSFSWFNHSCLPNACYRFELAPWHEDSTSCQPHSYVFPASTGEALDAWQAWKYEEGGLTNELSKYAPRVVVRSVKPIKKGEEVCITYIDLLQNTEARQFNLWSEYRFICCCQRCTASPEMYVDCILNCDAENLNFPVKDNAALEDKDLYDVLHQAVAEYSLCDNPKACCDMLESMLSINSQSDLQEDELSGRKCTLHPLHCISLSAYITLASAYRFRAQSLNTGSLHVENRSACFKMSKTAAAYSFLLAGATHHLFLSDSSHMAAVSNFLLGAGETILDLVGSSKRESSTKTWETKFSFVSGLQCNTKEDSMSCEEFKSTCTEFVECILSLSSRCWPFLVEDLPYLEKIKNPVDFTWLGTAIFQPHLSLGGKDTATTSANKCFVCKHQSGAFIQEERGCLFNLAFHCLGYSKYLASICYGPRNYLSDRAKDLLESRGLAK